MRFALLELDTTLIVGLVAAVATVLSASIPYYMGKRAERNDKIRDKKISVYDDLSSKFSELLLTNNRDTRMGFFLAYNRAIAYADATVIEACDAYLYGKFEKDEKKVITPSQGCLRRYVKI